MMWGKTYEMPRFETLLFGELLINNAGEQYQLHFEEDKRGKSREIPVRHVILRAGSRSISRRPSLKGFNECLSFIFSFFKGAQGISRP